MGEGESDTRPEDSFVSPEEKRVQRAIDDDPAVQRAMTDMAVHDEVLQGQADLKPESLVDSLLDELIEEQKKTQPDPNRLADIRRQLQAEHPLVAAQTVTNETALRYMADKMETTELNDRETAVGEILRLTPSVVSLEKDITDMADEAIGETVEEYPDEMELILNDVAETKEGTIKELCDYLGLEPDEGFPAVLFDTKGLLQVNFEKLKSIFATLYNAQSKMLDFQGDMAEVVKAWKEEHHQGS